MEMRLLDDFPGGLRRRQPLTGKVSDDRVWPAKREPGRAHNAVAGGTDSPTRHRRGHMDTDKNHEGCCCMNRREAIRLSVAAGVALAAGGMTAIAEAATKDESPADKPEHARQQFLKSMNCSQALLETYGPDLGLPVPQARRVAAAFAGGMGMGSECGAVTGAYMVIGMKYGKTAESDSRADNVTFKRLAEFNRQFKAHHKYLTCSELLETDMGTPEGVKTAAGQGYFTSRCPAFVKTAAEILEKIGMGG